MLHSKKSIFVHPMSIQYMYTIYVGGMLDYQMDIIGNMLNYQVDIGSILDCQVHWLKVGNHDSYKHIKLKCIPSYNENKDSK